MSSSFSILRKFCLPNCYPRLRIGPFLDEVFYTPEKIPAKTKHTELVHFEFGKARNHCRRVREKAKCNYAQAIQAQIENRHTGFREIWKIFNQVLNRAKTTLLTIINKLELLSSSLDKGNLFAMIFASHSTLDVKDHPLPDFSCFSHSVIILLQPRMSQDLSEDLTPRSLLV